MKKIFFAALMMLTSLGMMAQENQLPEEEVRKFTVMPKVGLNIATFTGDNGERTEGTSPRYGVTLGLEGEYQLASRWGLTFGLMYSQQGQKVDTHGFHNGGMRVGDTTIKVDYLNVPVLAKWYFTKNKKWALRFGIQPCFNVNARVTGRSVNNESLSSYGISMNKFDLAFPMGVTFGGRNLAIEATWFRGISHPFSLEGGNTEDLNTVFQLTLGYRMDL